MQISKQVKCIVHMAIFQIDNSDSILELLPKLCQLLLLKGMSSMHLMELHLANCMDQNYYSLLLLLYFKYC